MARIITRELAEKITKKLRGVKIPAKGRNLAHDMISIEHDGQVVAIYGIRRSSEKDKGHDHIPPAISVGPSFAKLLGQCPKSRDDWLNQLRDKGIISS